MLENEIRRKSNPPKRQMDYEVEKSDGTVGRASSIIPSGTDYLGWTEQGLGASPELCLYGNPEGLRALAQKLEQIADLDQSKAGLSDDDGFHVHLSTGLNTEAVEQLPTLRIGRVDAADAPDEIRCGFPAFVSEFSDASMSE